jgi:glycerol-3-phosphate acyltransferase PlsY
LLGDLLKGIVACLIGMVLIGNVTGFGYIGVIAGGMAAILGHNWPLYFGFKGGRGVLTSFAVMMMINWKIALVALALFILVVAITRYVSLGSVLAALSLPIFTLVPVFVPDFGARMFLLVFTAAIGFLIIVRHAPNMKRLLKGTESKLGDRKKEEPVA